MDVYFSVMILLSRACYIILVVIIGCGNSGHLMIWCVKSACDDYCKIIRLKICIFDVHRTATAKENANESEINL